MNSLLNLLLRVLLSVGRSDGDRVSLLGDLEEEHRTRLARGGGRLAAFAWYAAEICRAVAWGLRDAFRRRAFAPPRSHTASTHRGHSPLSVLSWPDIKLSLRLLIRHPGLTLVSSLGITVGIAITAGMFGFFNAVLAPTLPLDEGHRIIALENWDVVQNNENRQSLHDFVTWRDQMKSVVEISAFQTIVATMQTGDRLPETVRVAAMSASGFRVARVPALLGRFLTVDDEREAAPRVVVIGYDVWRSRFAQDRAVLGQRIKLGNIEPTVVGVMPEGFAFPVNHQYWIALRANPTTYARGAGPVLFAFGRLAPGATMASAQAELAVIGQRMAAEFPATNATLKPQVLDYTKPLNDVQDTGVGAWMMMQLTISLVLIIVAFNVAILLYARTATRRGEIAVRTALGASRGRIVTQLFVEALVLSLPPALVGLALGQYGIGIGNRIMAQELSGWGGAAPFWQDHGVQASTMVYVLGSVVVTAAIAGILPALHATRRGSGADLRQLGGSTGIRLGRMWNALIVVQIAFAVAVLPAAIKTGIKEARDFLTGPNYPVEEFVGFSVAAGSGANPLGNRLPDLKRRLLDDPEVAGVTFTASLAQRASTGRIEVEGLPVEEARPTSGFGRVTTFGIDTDYLGVYGLHVVTGRPFDALDPTAINAPVIVDRSFERRFLNGRSAVGRRIRYAASAAKREPSPWYEVVGVAENLQRNPIDPDVVRPTVLYPVAPDRLAGAGVTVRLRGSAASRMDDGFARKIHQAVVAVDPDLRMGEIRARAQADSQDALVIRLVALALSLILMTVLLFSAAGVYSLMSFTVAQRRREIGIRAALGASSMGLLRSVFSRVALQVAIGVVLGALGSMAIAPAGEGVVMAGRLAVVTPAIALTMVLVGVVAAHGPARRSLRIQPTEALRAE
jgi:putative ABC transport system permease protein